MKVKSFNYDPETNEESNKAIEEGGESMLHIEIEKENFRASNRMTVQKHTKIKDVTYWVVVASESDNQVLALKKLSIKRKVNIKVPVDVP